MKLATLNNGKRDGALVVVSRDLSRAVRVPQLAATLQAALDEWAELAPKLTAVYQQLNDGACADAFPFDETACLSPLPRAYQWADGSAYVNHVELVRKARGAEMPESFWHDPLIYQGGSDSFLPPRGTIPMGSEEWGIDFESEIAVITDDVPMGTSPQAAAGHIKLLMLVNDVSLRNLIPGELAKGFGFFQSKPSSSFSPLAITPDELGDGWRDGKVHLPLETHLNGALFGAPDAGVDMTFNFYELIAHAAKTRPLGAGCIIGSGTVSNYDRSRGSSCLAELRMLEIIESGQATTPFLRFGDTVSIAMQDRNGMSLFGTILQRVTPAGASQTK
ncbi:fumarylacetoacetate hydrolase family protein [Aeromonas hydrophila]|uniref:fumarylacetoacetate hydrolase family protein n=1 Tax=Aeromonas hydrophila TaxID=644 RepID=UPI0019157C77|nr:fumarylacetoacetate hydrolase family protein [Aeromonas hydrophila]MBQ4677426.1 2-keto-4-pentenoate hydratase [Aeromonas hydrophila]MBW3814030.1 2-keto-4-pentenoate hydratase [Aeromonas hydrophila]MCF7679259.1 fumarylacetoacetate hydrolase family protein [Aeromonas hydrophila]MCF7692306.1 fumarylacetoacetate hydrolase family protein [Aeromonas hydrophila]MCF7773107.1 fumarylacetoacetate hydrolase family protein [Aeromonas hydrophila]